jgi:hypothetical protein
MPNYSTREAAKKLGLALSSLTKYITLKQIPVPPLTRVGGVRVRLWNDTDIHRVQQFLPRIANGRKTRYQKEHSGVSTQQSGKSKGAQAKASQLPKKKKKK